MNEREVGGKGMGQVLLGSGQMYWTGLARYGCTY